MNGEKKFITSGCKAHYFTTAVRTITADGNSSGVSLLLIEKDMPGVIVRYMSVCICMCVNMWVASRITSPLRVRTIDG